MCQIALSKKTEKVLKKKGTTFVERLRDFPRYCHYSHCCHYHKYIFLLYQYYWKEQFDTVYNRCDVLRAAFCDSCDVFVTAATSVLFSHNCHNNFTQKNLLKIFTQQIFHEKIHSKYFSQKLQLKNFSQKNSLGKFHLENFTLKISLKIVTQQI